MKAVEDIRTQVCPCAVVVPVRRLGYRIKGEREVAMCKCAIVDWQPEEGYDEPCLKSDAITCPLFLSNVVWKLEHYRL